MTKSNSISGTSSSLVNHLISWTLWSSVCLYSKKGFVPIHQLIWSSIAEYSAFDPSKLVHSGPVFHGNLSSNPSQWISHHDQGEELHKFCVLLYTIYFFIWSIKITGNLVAEFFLMAHSSNRALHFSKVAAVAWPYYHLPSPKKKGLTYGISSGNDQQFAIGNGNW